MIFKFINTINKISIKISLLFIVMIIIITSGVAIITFFFERDQLIKDLTSDANHILDRTANSISIPLWYYNDSQIMNAINYEMVNKDVFAIRIKDKYSNYYGRVKDKNFNVIDLSEEEKIEVKKTKNVFLYLKKNIYQDKDELGVIELFITDFFLKEVLQQSAQKFLIQTIIISLLILSTIFLNVKIIILDPLIKLKNAVQQFAKKNFSVRITIKSKDELGILSTMFNSMAETIQNYSTDLKKMVLERTEQLNLSNKKLIETNKELEKAMKALWGEMELAEKIQTVLLPSSPTIKGFEIATYMKTASIVGGDYYDIINVAGKDWLIIGDVSGHGIVAGLIMMMMQTCIHLILNQKSDISPKDLLTVINKTITDNINKIQCGEYITITAIAYAENNNFYFSGMHLPIIIYRAKEKKADLIETKGFWLGFDIDLNKVNKNEKFMLADNDLLILYSDGIIEARNQNDGLYTLNRLIDKVIENSGQSPQKLVQNIIADLQGFRQDDDMTLVVLKKKQ